MRARVSFCTRSTAASAVRPPSIASRRRRCQPLVVGEHAVGLEHVAVLAGGGQVLVLEHLVDARPCSSSIAVSSRASSSAGSSAIELGDDDARLVQHDVAERDALRDRLALA